MIMTVALTTIMNNNDNYSKYNNYDAYNGEATFTRRQGGNQSK